MAPRCATLDLVAVVFLAVTGRGTTKNANPDRCCDRGFSSLPRCSNLPKSLRYASAMMLTIHSSSPASARTAKPPLRSGDDADEDSILNRRVIKKPRFRMRSDIRSSLTETK